MFLNIKINSYSEGNDLNYFVLYIDKYPEL